MNLNELYRKLSIGELSNLSISGEGSGTIIESKRPSIVLLTNEGMRELYKKFVLRDKTLMLQMQEGRTTYRLEPRFSVHNAEVSGAKRPYIIDSHDDPFNDSVIKVLQVYDNWGTELTLNDRDNGASLFTPSGNVLQIPNPLEGCALSVNYQTLPNEIDGQDLEEIIDIPVVLEKALTSYIAGQVLGNMNTQESNAKSQEHLLRFESICKEAEEKDLLSISSVATNTKFEKRGWA